MILHINLWVDTNMENETLTKKDEDLPKSIVVILVILAVAISVLGTFTVINEMNRLNSAPVYTGSPVQTAKVSLTVIDPNAGMAHATGKIAFEIIRPEAE
jgi:uncharacterized membrane protein